ncbi:CheR family methyltransferase [Vreelandella sp. EE22]
MNPYTPFKKLVYKHYGLQLDGLAEQRLIKAITALHVATGETETASLLQRLQGDRALFDDLISQLTINETYFYREPEALRWLAEHHLPARLAEKTPPLRILSAGCSSGEEPYSLAMALMERFGRCATTLFSITGGDVDQRVLAKAQRGLYSGMAFRALPEALKKRYFKARERHYLIDASLRDWVDFQTFNVFAPVRSPADTALFDVILFRNVSIYFDEGQRLVIQKHLRDRLAPKGIVLCGVSETLGNDLGVFELAQSQGIFHFRQSAATAHDPGDAVPSAAFVESAPETPSPAAPGLASPEGPEAPLPSSLVSFEQRVQTALECLDHNRFDDAEVLLTALLDEKPWSVDVLLLAGLVARWQKKAQRAYEYFKRAIYAVPECWPAHFYQAELFRLDELPKTACQPRRGYEATLRLLEASPVSKGGLTVIASPIPPGDARFLAKRYLNADFFVHEVD